MREKEHDSVDKGKKRQLKIVCVHSHGDVLLHGIAHFLAVHASVVIDAVRRKATKHGGSQDRVAVRG